MTAEFTPSGGVRGRAALSRGRWRPEHVGRSIATIADLAIRGELDPRVTEHIGHRIEIHGNSLETTRVIYRRFEHVISVEGPFQDHLPGLLRGGTTIEGAAGSIEMPALEPLVYWEGPMALLARRGRGAVVAFDGLIHLDRKGIAIYVETGEEISGEEIDRIRSGDGPWQVDFHGTTTISRPPDGAAGRFTAGTCKEDIWACILARPPAGPARGGPPIYEQIVIELGEAGPTVLTRADARTRIR